MKEPDDNEWAENVRKFGLFSVILFDLVGSTAAGVGVGYFVWAKWGIPRWIMAVTGLLGLIAGFYTVYLISKKEL